MDNTVNLCDEMGMENQELQAYLYQQIPMTQLMGLKIIRVDDSGAWISAPLEQNRNHMGTAFGGSIHSLLVLACYAWLFYKIRQQNYEGHIVLKASQTEYFHPVEGELIAVCRAPEDRAFAQFARAFSSKGRGRLRLQAVIESADQRQLCRLNGEFVALGDKN